VARILCAVTGSIAAYKAAEVVSRLVQLGHEVHVVMTRAATELVRPRTFSALSRHAVHSDLWDPMEAFTEHVSLAELPDVAVVAPATANIIGKLAHGIADEIVSTTMLAVTAPVLIAPAMNVHMFENPVVQENIGKLSALGYRFLEPGEGYLACGDIGPGRMAEPAAIVAAVARLLSELRSGTRAPEGGETCGG
jgi:phosphopantothenoylcysteine decarboxylase/phosphopantothenate--cysteine ligase